MRTLYSSRPSLMCSSRSPRVARPVSWVTISKLFLRSRARFNKSSTIAPPVAESRLPIGSSAKMISGSLVNARAIATRCCSPPESSQMLHSIRQTDCGQTFFGRVFCRRPSDHSRERNIFQGGQFRQQKVALEHETHLFVAKTRSRGRGTVVKIAPFKFHGARFRPLQTG